ncbi:hypothetical protein HPP92_013380 [Vanilla planifolia]|uniref:Uncharacterized protein n=1 Tax=Vanilla planifolia TaxID=51239 RepID=A0A835V0K1_VANPL|nr:hypothetical protein HPP92_013811 [Vanilla planifolia]KAG0478661.1 hypothetical protein HPP92_013380 [Vanilla planifolia]
MEDNVSGVESGGNPAAGLKEKVVREWQRIRVHAETYPYVWGSYILVYGGFGAYLTYRWRKLRRTEDRVRNLHEKLRKLVEAEDAAAGSRAKDGSSLPKSATPPP